VQATDVHVAPVSGQNVRHMYSGRKRGVQPRMPDALVPHYAR
jgi:hypothetical protein